ncbi:hypothetical protein BDV93DRAFT_601499 [Ceratobasidium sp. AG-I]|nr:hypothetical protein BDV93DRAFT_601499 [Ceratobasidium sp. AG-I]
MPPKFQSLNPIFTKWLEEMRDELDPESKYRNIYHRAAKSMKVHPKYLEHPKECVEVKFIGPKIRDQLLKKHNELQANQQVRSSASSPKPSQAATFTTTGTSPTSVRNTQGDLDWHTTSNDDAIALSQQRQVSNTHPPTPSQPATPKPLTRKKPSVPKQPSARTAKPSDSDSDLDLATAKTPKAKVSSQPRKVATKSATPRATKRTKPASIRPRLSAFVPAPAATSDIEPEDSPNSSDDARSGDGPFPSVDPIVFPAGSYTIQLILDEREVKSTKNRDYMLNGLKKRGVDVTKRSLEVGDMCWVACLNNSTGSLQDECTMDYIVERKRLDDLKGSILDGRFHEQKFRLKHTGILHVYYLVEDYDTERLAKHWKDQINTALSSTQVIDRFFLKETRNIEDTLYYLSGLHKTIVDLHKDKPLYIIPPHLVRRYDFLALKKHLRRIQPERTYHTTYSSYQNLNRKNGFYTLQDCMARMLQCIRGLSEEKIAALLEHYPTPRSLFEAFREAEAAMSSQPEPAASKGKGKAKQAGAQSPQLILTELGGVGRRKLGPALSRVIYEVFMDHKYD